MMVLVTVADDMPPFHGTTVERCPLIQISDGHQHKSVTVYVTVAAERAPGGVLLQDDHSAIVP